MGVCEGLPESDGDTLGVSVGEVLGVSALLLDPDAVAERLCDCEGVALTDGVPDGVAAPLDVPEIEGVVVTLPDGLGDRVPLEVRVGEPVCVPDIEGDVLPLGVPDGVAPMLGVPVCVALVDWPQATFSARSQTDA